MQNDIESGGIRIKGRLKRLHTAIPAFLATTITATFMLSSAAVSASTGAHWSYKGHDGPSNWGTLSQEYEMCGRGENQSPIDINTATYAELFDWDFNYGAVPLQIVNNGHTIQINYNTTVIGEEFTIELNKKKYPLPSATTYNSSISISGEEYNLLQVHFHSPSEHRVIGASHAMEAHLVHANDAGQLAVVGVFLKEGQSNKFISKLWKQMPRNVDGVHTYTGVRINVEDLLPKDRDFYHYRGSLTTPPCSEGVRWFVMRTPVEVSPSQISQFLSTVSENARPVQPVNSRFLLKNL